MGERRNTKLCKRERIGFMNLKEKWKMSCKRDGTKDKMENVFTN